MTAVVFFIGNLVYLIWGTTDQQAWDAEDYLQAKDPESESNAHQMEFKSRTDSEAKADIKAE